MANCKIHIQIGDNDIIVDDVDSSHISTLYTQIKQKLIDSKQFDLFKKLITTASPIKYGNVKSGVLVANTTTDQIFAQYGVQFPISANNVLLVNNCKVNGKETYGVIEDAFGNELYVVKSNYQNLKSFSKFLQLKDKVENYNFEKLPPGFKTREQLINHIMYYLLKGDSYVDWNTKSIPLLKSLLYSYNIVKDLVYLISEKPLTNKVEDAFSQSVMNFLKYKKDKNKLIPYITITRFKEIASAFFENTDDIDEILNKKFLSQSDVNLRLSYKDDTYINFSYFGDSLQNKYEQVTQQSIGKLVSYQEDYNGYYIFKLGNDFIVSRNWITLNTQVQNKTLKSILEARKEIDNKNTQSKISNNFILELHSSSPEGVKRVLSTSKVGVKNDVIRVLDIDIEDKVKISSPNIYVKYQDMSLDKFRETIAEQYKVPKDFKDIINSNEKAMILLYSLGGEKSIDQVLVDIKNAKYKYYIIENIGSKKQFKYQTTLYNLKEEDLGLNIEHPSYKYTSMFTVLNQINDQMFKQFGFKANILSASQIQNDFTDKLGPGIEQEKAFIYDGQVYVNGSEASISDLLHEYLHIFLGALKTKDFELYSKIIEDVSKHHYFKTIKESMSYNFRYKNLADTDLNEEVFVKLLSKYLSSEQSGNMDAELFKAKVQIETALFPKSDLGLNMLQFTNKFTDSPDPEIVKQFGEDARTYRMITNYISEKIKDNTLIENCK